MLCALLVGRDAYLDAGGKIDRELFDDDESESWVDVALLERLAADKMDWLSDEIKDQHRLACALKTLVRRLFRTPDRRRCSMADLIGRNQICPRIMIPGAECEDRILGIAMSSN